jgi:hypothetical protein
MTQREVEAILGLPPGTHSKKSFYIELVSDKGIPTGWEDLQAAFSKGFMDRVLVPDHAIWNGRYFSPRQKQWITDEGIIDIRFDEAGTVVEKHFLFYYVEPHDDSPTILSRLRKWFGW